MISRTTVATPVTVHVAPAESGHCIRCGGFIVTVVTAVNGWPKGVMTVVVKTSLTRDRSDVRNHASPGLSIGRVPDVTLTATRVW